MFFHEPSKVLRRQFEQRTWRRDETFGEYLHQKVIMGNRIRIDEEEMVEYIIEGIPDAMLRDQARVQRFRTKRALLEVFERVTLCGRWPPGATGNARERRVQERVQKRVQERSERENPEPYNSVSR